MSLYSNGGKRACDFILASLATAILCPLHAVCAVAVLLDDGVPVYYVQTRTGKDGKEFGVIKFRTMKTGTHELSGGYPSTSMVTRVGRILRKMSLDELPQLINVMRGEMSLVGPRPALPDQVARYTDRQRARLMVRPGLTGLAQVRYRNSATWSVRIKADLEYIDKLSPWTDLSIIARTAPAVLFGVGVLTGQSAADVDDLGTS